MTFVIDDARRGGRVIARHGIRTTMVAVGLAMSGLMAAFSPAPGRFVVSFGAAVLVSIALRLPFRTDPEVVALVRDGIARSDEQSVKALRELRDELAGIRQLLDGGT